MGVRLRFFLDPPPLGVVFGVRAGAAPPELRLGGFGGTTTFPRLGDVDVLYLTLLDPPARFISSGKEFDFGSGETSLIRGVKWIGVTSCREKGVLLLVSGETLVTFFFGGLFGRCCTRTDIRGPPVRVGETLRATDERPLFPPPPFLGIGT